MRLQKEKAGAWERPAHALLGCAFLALGSPTQSLTKERGIFFWEIIMGDLTIIQMPRPHSEQLNLDLGR